MAIETVDTALKSIDLVLFEYKILGTTWVPHFSVKFHLWVELIKFSAKDMIQILGFPELLFSLD